MVDIQSDRYYDYQIELYEVDGIRKTAWGDHPMPSVWNDFTGLYKPVIQWCEENCQDTFTEDPIDGGYMFEADWTGYRFTFKKESDALAFRLRWGGEYRSRKKYEI